jgi:sensor domain CHASE-containing protein
MGMDSRHFLIFSIPFLLIILFQLQLYITQTQNSRDEQALSKKTDAVIQRLANEIKELRSSVESSAPKDKYPQQISRVQSNIFITFSFDTIH